MSAAEALVDEPATTDESPWLVRPYMPESDDSGALYYLLGIAYTRSRAGIRAGACGAGREQRGPRNEQEILQQKAFMAAHRPIWNWLLENADVSLSVDPEAPHIIWAWLVTSGDVIHAIGCKRTAVEGGIATDVVRHLLGDRLTRHQVCSLELPQMRTRGSEAIGLDRPKMWSMDPTWLLVRMGVK